MRTDLARPTVPLFLGALLFLTAERPCAALGGIELERPLFHPRRLLVQPRPGADAAAVRQLHLGMGVDAPRRPALAGGLQVVDLPEGCSIPTLVEKYRHSALIEFAEPDFRRRLATTEPNDTRFVDGTLWGLKNTGQNGGVAGADISAPEAWDLLTSAENIIVAVIDTGIRTTHEDLAANLWTDPITGGHGFNAFTGSTDPSDDEGHGSLVSGVVGAVGNNGKGVTGVAWKVQLMACKAFDSARNGYDSTLIACIDFARTNGARIINASWGDYAFGEALSNAVYRAREAGIIFVAAAGNEARSIDANPYYPACLAIDNVVSVAYTTRTDALGKYSNYGSTNVHLAAPGDQIYSTFFTGDSAYLGPVAGTSVAAPYVSGSLALILARFPAISHQQALAQLLAGTDPLAALQSKCRTGGRLNLRNALSPRLNLGIAVANGGGPRLDLSTGPNRRCVIEASTNLVQWEALVTNTTAADGSFSFTDGQSADLPRKFYRAVSAP